MNGLDKDDLDILQEVLNEEILNYLQSGYKLDDEYVVTLRKMLKKLNLKEVYNFEKYNKKTIYEFEVKEK